MRIFHLWTYSPCQPPRGLGRLESDLTCLLEESLVLRGGPVFQAAMRPLLVVVAAPSFDLFLSILQAQKPVLVQTLLPKAAVKGFDEGIVRGLPRPGEVQDDAMGVGPQVNFLGDELRAVVYPDALRHPILSHRPVEGGDHVVAFVAETHPDKGTNTAKII